MRLRSVSFFEKIVNQKLKNVNKFWKIEKTDGSHMHFGFTNIGSEMHNLRVIAERNI